MTPLILLLGLIPVNLQATPYAQPPAELKVVTAAPQTLGVGFAPKLDSPLEVKPISPKLYREPPEQTLEEFCDDYWHPLKCWIREA